MTDEVDFEQWYETGVRNGWCGAIVCVTHDGVPTTEDEDLSFEDGDDLCVPMVRFYQDAEQRLAVEANHTPSVWRKSNAGLG